MTGFSKAFARTINVEGGFSNNPNDSGGRTMFGITEKLARAYGYGGPMEELPLHTAKMIYKKAFWDVLQLDNITTLSEDIAEELFDTAVNVSPSTAARFLQRSLNVLNRGATLFDDIQIDGHVGKITVAALADFLQRRDGTGERVLLNMLNSLQGAYYVELAEQRAKDEDFVFGWFRHRVFIHASEVA